MPRPSSLSQSIQRETDPRVLIRKVKFGSGAEGRAVARHVRPQLLTDELLELLLTDRGLCTALSGNEEVGEDVLRRVEEAASDRICGGDHTHIDVTTLRVLTQRGFEVAPRTVAIAAYLAGHGSPGPSPGDRKRRLRALGICSHARLPEEKRGMAVPIQQKELERLTGIEAPRGALRKLAELPSGRDRRGLRELMAFLTAQDGRWGVSVLETLREEEWQGVVGRNELRPALDHEGYDVRARAVVLLAREGRSESVDRESAGVSEGIRR